MKVSPWANQEVMRLREMHVEIDEAVAPFISTSLAALMRTEHKHLSPNDFKMVQEYYMRYDRTERTRNNYERISQMHKVETKLMGRIDEIMGTTAHQKGRLLSQIESIEQTQKLIAEKLKL